MNTYSIWNNDLGYRSITYVCYNDPMAGGPYEWTIHFSPDEYQQYEKMIRQLNCNGYVKEAAE
jgi:hypothetical protein